MLSIILFILKLIGIILAFILFLIILVLLVPIRYNIYANYKEEIYGEFKVHWLLRFIYLKGVYVGENFNIKLRILGKVFYDSDKVDSSENPKEEEAPKKEKRKIKEKKAKRDKHTEIKVNRKVDIDSKKDISSNNDTTFNEEITPNITKIANDDIKIDKKSQNKTNIQQESVTDRILVEKDNDIKNNLPKEGQNINDIKDSKKDEVPILNQTDDIKSYEDSKKDDIKHKEKPFFAKVKLIIAKIGNLIIKVFNIPKKIKDIFVKIGNKFRQLKDKLLNMKKVIDRIKRAIEKIKLFLQDEVNKDGMKYVFKSLKRIWWHVKPKKIIGEVEFGTKDPYETGKILAFISMGYGLYGKDFKIYPNFEEEILTGKVTIIGRIRLITLLIIGVKLILYKNNRQLVKNIMVLKEEL